MLTDKEDAPAGTKKVSDGAREAHRRYTYLDVRLFITPGVVSYCFASAKIDAIPDIAIDRRASALFSSGTPFGLTNCRVEIGYHRSESDNDQLNGLAPFRPLDKVLQSIPNPSCGREQGCQRIYERFGGPPGHL